MSGNFRIERRVMPIAGVGGHSYWALYDGSGHLVSEIHGLATGIDGKSKYIGSEIIGDTLKAYVFNRINPNETDDGGYYSGGGAGWSGYWDKNDPHVTVWTGSEQDAERIWQLGVDAANKINQNNYGYSWYGGEVGDGNCNSVNKTVGDAMGLPLPDLPGWTPGEKNLFEWDKRHGWDPEVWSWPVVVDLQPSMDKAEKTTSPIMIDLDGDGVKTTSISEGMFFDLNGDGASEKTGWSDGVDGFLAFDRNGNGVIDSGLELFGNETTLRNGVKAKNGFEALLEYDTN